jgi:UDP-N-acetylmuramate--alanine ligase
MSEEKFNGNLNNKYYFIAIGGIGMSGLAKYLLEQGHEVSGSDVYESKYTHELENLGARVFIGHDENNLPEDCTVVASTAIRKDNPELQKAHRLGLSVLHRSDLLAEIAYDFQTAPSAPIFIGYAGTHGKTTTSGLAAYVLANAGLEPSFVVGGFVPELNSNAHSARGKYFVAELDESDGTIVKYAPNIAVINNIEADHLDFFTGGLDDILKTFGQFLDNLPQGAVVLANSDCGNVRKLTQGRKVVTYGLDDGEVKQLGGWAVKTLEVRINFNPSTLQPFNPSINYLARNIEYTAEYTTFDVYYNGEFLTDLKIILKGKHNVYNALAVFASLNEAGAEVEKIKPYFAAFTGMGRRFEKVAELDITGGGITVYDDYAHHPTEIKATLNAAQSLRDAKLLTSEDTGLASKPLSLLASITAVFQPHRYTRLQKLWDEFLEAFDGADRVVVTDVYAASEDPVEGVNAEIFTAELARKLDVPVEHIGGDMQEFARKLLPTLKPGDIVIGMGAGTVTYLGKELTEADNAVGRLNG